MKTALLLLVAAACLIPETASAEKLEKTDGKQYAYVLAPFIHVLKERRPESEIVGNAARGDKFLVKRVGEYWVEVYVPPKNETGWIELGMETPKVEIRTEAEGSPYSKSMAFGGIILLAVAAAVILLFRAFINARHKKALESIGHTHRI